MLERGDLGLVLEGDLRPLPLLRGGVHRNLPDPNPNPIPNPQP